MGLASANAPVGTAAHPGDGRLHGARLGVVRSIWGLVVLIDVVVLAVGIPAYAAQLNTFCSDPTRVTCGPLQLVSAQQGALHQVGVSLGDYALYTLVIDAVTSLLFVGLGALVFWFKSREWMGLFVSFFLITYGAFGLDGTHLVGLDLVPWLAIAAFPLFFLEWPAQGILFYTFPDGRFVPRWAWLLTFLFIIQFGFYFLPYPYNIDNWPPVLNTLETLVVYGSMVGTQVYRYMTGASPIQRQQIKWLAFGFSLALLLFALLTLLTLAFPDLNSPSSWYQLVGPITLSLGYLPIAFGIGIALLRYRLWDIDVIINRTLVYDLLTGLLGALYVGLIIGLQAPVNVLTGKALTSQAADSPLAIVVSTLIIAALFLPVRRRIQSIIDRRFYRRKYDAEKALAAFSATLRNEVDLNQVHEQLLAVVNETMQPAHVSLWLRVPTSQQERGS